MTELLMGLLTMVGVLWWGARWYVEGRDRTREELPTQPPHRPASTLRPLVPAEEAEQLIRRARLADEGGEAPLGVSVEAPPAPTSSAGETEPGAAVTIAEAPAVYESRVPATPSPAEEGAEADMAAPEEDSAPDAVEGYCARCRARRYLKDAAFTRTRRGKPAIRGSCMICGAGMLVFTSERAWQAHRPNDL